MCFHYGNVNLREVVLKYPVPSSGQSSEIRLATTVVPDESKSHKGGTPEKTPEKWTVRHEGLPIRGQLANDLPATVLEVSESACTGSRVVNFWITLGCQLEYEVRKTGHEYLCLHEGHELRVLVVSLTVVRGVRTRNVTKDCFFLDVSTSVPLPTGAAAKQQPAQQTRDPPPYVPAARAIGTFALRLLPLVQLRKAEFKVN